MDNDKKDIVQTQPDLIEPFSNLTIQIGRDNHNVYMHIDQLQGSLLLSPESALEIANQLRANANAVLAEIHKKASKDKRKPN